MNNNTNTTKKPAIISTVPAVNAELAADLLAADGNKYRLLSALDVMPISKHFETVDVNAFRRAAIWSRVDDLKAAADDAAARAKRLQEGAKALDDGARARELAAAARGVTLRADDLKRNADDRKAADGMRERAAKMETRAADLRAVIAKAAAADLVKARAAIAAMTVKERRLFDLFRSVTLGAPMVYDAALLEAFYVAARDFRAAAEGTKERTKARAARKAALGDLFAFWAIDAAKLNASEVDFITDNLLPLVTLSAARVSKKDEADRYAWVMKEVSAASVERVLARVIWAKSQKIKFNADSVVLLKF